MSPKWSSAHMTALFMHMSNLGYAITSRDDNLDKWVPGISVGEVGEGGGESQVWGHRRAGRDAAGLCQLPHEPP